jgi:deoxyribodipyrimidine photo-lyase
MSAPAILWFRRDLRIADHRAIAAAAASGGAVLPLFVDDPALRSVSGAARLAFLSDRLLELSASLDGALSIQRGDPGLVVPAIAAQIGASTVYVTRDHSPRGRERDRLVAERLRADGRRLVGVGSNYLVEPGTVRKADGSPYRVFTPFFKAWLKHLGPEVIEPVETPQVEWMTLAGDPMPSRPDLGFEIAPAGDGAIGERWTAFRNDALSSYADQRDLPAVDGTSRLSTALKWGAVHPRSLVADLVAPSMDQIVAGEFNSADERVFVSELAWREFYADVLFERPETAWRNLNPAMDAMPVDTDRAAEQRFGRWSRGETGFPIVDAAMRQLLATGWMHNRLRMIVASFLVKDLHLPWQWGAAHFMAHLSDGDLASNSHGWQWAAGTGTDAAPYFRVFNPWTQQKRYDPDGEFIAQWVPGADGAAIAPMVDHAVERDEALRRYRSVTRR